MPLQRRFRSPKISRSKPSSLRLLKFLPLIGLLALPFRSRADGIDANDVLKRTAAMYQSLKSYEGKITVQTVDGEKVGEQHFSESASGSSFRVADDDARGLLRISDGQSEWTLDRATNEYAKTAAATSQPSWIGALAKIDQNVKDTDVADEEAISLNGNLTKVYIVELTRTSWPIGSPSGAQSVTYSIDEKSLEVYKAITYTAGASQIALYSLTQRNQSVAAASFAFLPPAGAKQVDTAPVATASLKSIIGTQAPDFTLKDSSGKSYSLHELRGKVVVIDFIGSWCPVCLAQTPYIQQVFNTYPDKDLEVYGLDVGEDAKQVNDYGFNSAFSFPLLTGVEPEVTAKYFVDDYPTTYIISREGQIVFKATGTDNPRGFLTAVASAVAKKN